MILKFSVYMTYKSLHAKLLKLSLLLILTLVPRCRHFSHLFRDRCDFWHFLLLLTRSGSDREKKVRSRRQNNALPWFHMGLKSRLQICQWFYSSQRMESVGNVSWSNKLCSKFLGQTSNVLQHLCLEMSRYSYNWYKQKLCKNWG